MAARSSKPGIALAAVGGIGGIVVSSWALSVSAHRGGGEPMVDVGEGVLTAYSAAMLLLFCATMVAVIISLIRPRVAGLALIAIGGLTIVLVVVGILMWLLGGLLFAPIKILILIAGVLLMVSRMSAA